jgi:hypothetical protein
MKPGRMRWTWHIANMGQKRNAYRFWWKSQKERDHQEDLDVGGSVILRWILEKQYGILWTGLIWLGIRTSGGLL